MRKYWTVAAIALEHWTFADVALNIGIHITKTHYDTKPRVSCPPRLRHLGNRAAASTA
jgi:hypothetical protein